MRIRIEIKLGNEAMRTPEDVAAELRRIILKLERGLPLEIGTEANIRDMNGNTVGAFKVTR